MCKFWQQTALHPTPTRPPPPGTITKKITNQIKSNQIKVRSWTNFFIRIYKSNYFFFNFLPNWYKNIWNDQSFSILEPNLSIPVSSYISSSSSLLSSSSAIFLSIWHLKRIPSFLFFHFSFFRIQISKITFF